MTDNFRDRITAAVARELVLQAQDRGEYQTRDCYKVADAVIEALGLREESCVQYTAQYKMVYGDQKNPPVFFCTGRCVLWSLRNNLS